MPAAPRPPPGGERHVGRRPSLAGVPGLDPAHPGTRGRLLLSEAFYEPAPRSEATARASNRRRAERGGTGTYHPGTALRVGASHSRDGCRLALPVAVEGTLNLHRPDEPADDREEHPEPRPTRHRRAASVAPVHLPDLRRHHEEVHRVDHERDNEAYHAPDALPRVLLHLLEDLVHPVQVIDAEGHDRDEDHEQHSTRLADRTLISWRGGHSRHARYLGRGLLLRCGRFWRRGARVLGVAQRILLPPRS